MTLLPDTLGAMLEGTGRLRFLLQPLIAITLGIRDGRQDAGGLRTLATPLIVAVLLDAILQYIILRSVQLWHALLAGTILIALPYAVTRGLTNRYLQHRRPWPANE